MERRKAMVVDDDQEVRDLLTLLLEEAGWEVVAAEDGDEAVLLVASVLPDLVVLDLRMPGMDGHAVLQDLRTDPRTAHVPIIMVTAANQLELGTYKDAEAVGRMAKTAPPEVFLEKPVDREAFLEALETAMGGLG